MLSEEVLGNQGVELLVEVKMRLSLLLVEVLVLLGSPGVGVKEGPWGVGRSSLLACERNDQAVRGKEGDE
jgi:hypothetical protein